MLIVVAFVLARADAGSSAGQRRAVDENRCASRDSLPPPSMILRGDEGRPRHGDTHLDVQQS
jgi:hypothetical protein